MILCDDGLYQSWQNNGVANVLLEFWVQLYFFLSVAFKVMIFHINESNMIKKEFSKHFSCFKAALAFWYWPKSATASRLFLNLCYILWSYTNVMRQVLLQPKYYFLNNKPLCDYIMIYPRTFFYHQFISLFCFDFWLLSLFQLVF